MLIKLTFKKLNEMCGLEIFAESEVLTVPSMRRAALWGVK
jgi:hypothetical protein